MKKRVILFGTLFVAFVTVISCNKDEIVKNENNESGVSVSSNNQDKSLETFVNPYEYIGEIHNKSINDLRNNTSYESLSRDDKANLISQTVRNELTARGFSYNTPALGLNDELNAFLTDQDTKTHEEIWQELLDDLPKNQKGFAVQFDNALNKYANNLNFELLIHSLKVIEHQVYTSNKFNEEDKKFLLSFLALGRNSFILWREKDIIDGGDHLFGISKWRADLKGWRQGWRRARDDGFNWSDSWEQAEFDASVASEMYGGN